MPRTSRPSASARRLVERFAIFLLTLSAATNAWAEDVAAPGEFFRLLAKNFDTWDRDESGDLSENEVELAVHDPQVCGADAAAAAALRRAVRGNDIAPVTLAQTASVLNRTAPEGTPLPKFDALFDAAREKIEATRKELFVDEAPQIEAISQGRLGDCFLLASLGTAAHRAPDRLKAMLRAGDEGGLEVTLGSGRKLDLDFPTDAEIAIAATTRNTGTWAVAYEKAVGSVMLARSKSGRHVTPLSLIGVGGTPNVPLEILTGHFVRRHGCEGYREPKDDSGASAADLQPLRDDLTQTFAEGRLIVGGCGPIGSQAIVKGIYYNHSYGVLDYDRATDTVLFWNPFGNRFVPKGPQGLEFGYATERGQFRVPLKEAVMWFGSFSIETDEPSEIR